MSHNSRKRNTLCTKKKKDSYPILTALHRVSLKIYGLPFFAYYS